MISVVIRTKNQAEALEFLLYNLTTRYKEDIDEIIVLDNLSTDDSEKITKKYEARFETIRNFSYGGSANLAAKLATHPIVVIFSAHAYPVSHDFFKLIKNKFEGRTDLAGLRCLHQPNDYKNYILGVSSQEDPNKSGLIFCGSAFYKPIWEKIPFQEDIRTFEDKDWTLKVLKEGYKVEFVPSIFCYQIKRTKSQEFFRFKNEIAGNLYLWNTKITFRKILTSFAGSLLKLTKNYFTDLFYIFKKLFFNISFLSSGQKNSRK